MVEIDDVDVVVHVEEVAMVGGCSGERGKDVEMTTWVVATGASD